MRTRAEELENIAGKQFDLCVIGGGATGSACALDAQLRGLRTVLIEAGDFAGGTSSAATKIVHGGVRYLEEAIKGADLQEYRVLVRALHERVRMLENAPHLTRTLEFIVPSYHWIDVAYLDIGLTIYDWLAGPGRISPSQYLSKAETLKRMPELKRKGLIGSVAYADGQFDDARYNVTLVQTFTVSGGNALNHSRVSDFLRDTNGEITGVVVRDQLTGDMFSVNARAVLNATGPLSDSIRQLANPSLGKRMRPSKGAHILLPVDVFPTEDALLIPQTEDGRVIFAIPWGGRLLVGTTDEEVSPEDELKGYDLHLQFHGCGHTAGDIVVFCPQKRIVVTGDAHHSGFPGFIDSYPQLWPKQVNSILNLEFDHVLPGHGRAEHDRRGMIGRRHFIEELTERVIAGKKAGQSAPDLQRSITAASLKSLRAQAFLPDANPDTIESGLKNCIDNMYDRVERVSFTGTEPVRLRG